MRLKTKKKKKKRKRINGANIRLVNNKYWYILDLLLYFYIYILIFAILTEFTIKINGKYYPIKIKEGKIDDLRIDSSWLPF